MMKNNPHESIIAMVAILAMIVFAGCEYSFEPMQENDLYAFSMYGVLDVHADTQWVRVMSLSENLIPTSIEHDGTEVTLTRESSGTMVSFKDSLFVFGNDAHVWNYWSLEEIHPNEIYTMYADGPSGKSQLFINTPSNLPVPNVDYSISQETGIITGSSVEPLVTADMRYWVIICTDRCSPESQLVVISHLENVNRSPSGDYYFMVDDKRALASKFRVRISEVFIVRRELVVATGSEDWPDLSALDDEAIFLPDVISNVENGSGLIAGIASRKVAITQ